MMLKRQKTESSTIQETLSRLRERLPGNWTLSLSESGTLRVPRPDARIEIKAAQGRRVKVAVEVRRGIEPKEVANIAGKQARPGESPRIFVAPYLSPRTRDLLGRAGINYADTTGNVRLLIENEFVYVLTSGASENPVRESRPLLSLKGPIAGRVARALCDFPPPMRIGQLAERANASLASVSRVVNFLDREALLTRKVHGPIQTADWAGIIRRWVEKYSWVKSNRTTSWLAARGIESVMDGLRKPSLNNRAVTGSAAAARVAPIAGSRLVAIYSDTPAQLARELGLRETDAGANVIISEPFDSVVFDRVRIQDGIPYAALSQVVADLLTGPGRSPAEGEELIQWMKANESAWRAQ